MNNDEIMVNGKYEKCPCYINRPLHRYDGGCLIQSQVFHQQQTKEKPLLRCEEIANYPIKELYLRFCRKSEECEELKKVKEDAKIAFQILWNQTHTETGWSPHIFAQNMLLKFFGGMDAFNEVKKERKDLLNTVRFRGEALDLFVTELEQELMNYKQKCIDLESENASLKEHLEIICEEIVKEKVNEK